MTPSATLPSGFASESKRRFSVREVFYGAVRPPASASFPFRGFQSIRCDALYLQSRGNAQSPSISGVRHESEAVHVNTRQSRKSWRTPYSRQSRDREGALAKCVASKRSLTVAARIGLHVRPLSCRTPVYFCRLFPRDLFSIGKIVVWNHHCNPRRIGCFASGLPLDRLRCPRSEHDLSAGWPGGEIIRSYGNGVISTTRQSHADGNNPRCGSRGCDTHI